MGLGRADDKGQQSSGQHSLGVVAWPGHRFFHGLSWTKRHQISRLDLQDIAPATICQSSQDIIAKYDLSEDGASAIGLVLVSAAEDQGICGFSRRHPLHS